MVFFKQYAGVSNIVNITTTDLADIEGFAFPGDQVLVHIRRDPRLGEGTPRSRIDHPRP